MFKTFISKQGFENFKTDETLSAAAKQSLLNTGWRWSRYNQCWFPATKNAQEKAKEFIKDFQTVFLPETVSTVDNVTVHSNNEKAQEPPSISKADFIQEYLEKVNILSPNFSTDKFSVIAETLKNDSIMYLDNKTLGTVEFPSGTLGDLRKEKTGGYGMKHIIQGRYEKDGMNNTDIASLLYAITNVVEIAEVQDTSKDRINIVKNGIVVGLSRNWYGENKTWVITGFAENDKNNEMTQVAKDTIRTVNAQCGYALEHSHIRDQVGAITTFIDSVRQANKKSNEQKNENTNDNLKYLTPKNIASLTDWQNNQRKVNQIDTATSDENEKAIFSTLARVLDEGVVYNAQNQTLGKIELRHGNKNTGLQHIIERRYAELVQNTKVAMNEDQIKKEIVAISFAVANSLKDGEVIRQPKGNDRITKNGITAIVDKDKFGNFVLTSYADYDNQKEATDYIRAVIAKYEYVPEFLEVYAQVGAVIASQKNILQNKNLSNENSTQKTEIENNEANTEQRIEAQTIPHSKAINEHNANAYGQSQAIITSEPRELIKFDEFLSETTVARIKNIPELKEVIKEIGSKPLYHNDALFKFVKGGDFIITLASDYAKYKGLKVFDTTQEQEKLIALLQKNGIDVESYADWRKRITTVSPRHHSTNEEHANETPAPHTKKQIKDIRNQAKEILEKPDAEITEADKLILSQYEGAGGINEKDKTTEGVLNEFYTPQNVIDKVWHVVDTIVPNVKTVLEPSSGIGKFARGRNEKFTMYEIDETSSRIARLLNPHATVINEPYQKQFFNSDGRVLNKNFEQKQYDLVIGNPPYGAYTGKWKGLGEGKEFSRYEEYFISKGLDALYGGTNGNEVDNGMLAFVVPSSFLNSPSDKQKEIIAQKGTLVEAFRLPSGTFNTTDVGTDIIFIAKMQYDLNNATDKQVIAENIHKISNNNFFTEHPEHILGEIKTRTNRFGKEEAYVAVHKGLTVQDELNKIDEFYKVQQNETTKTIGPHLFSQKENVLHEKQLPENSVTVHSNANALSHEPTTLHKNEVRESKFHAPAPHETKQYLMSNEEFARLYEKQFDENEFNLTVSTKWNGEIDSNNFTDAKKEYIRSSKNYIEVKPDIFMHKEIFLSGNIYEKIKEQTTLLQNANDKNARALFEKNITLLEKIKPAPLALETIHIPIKSPLAENFLITHTNENGETVDLNLQESFILWAKNETIGDKYSRVAINYASANISREDLPSNISWADIVSYIDGNPVRADRVRSYYGRTDDEIANEKIIQKKLADEKRQNRSDIANVLFDKFIHIGLDSETQKKLQTQYNELFNSYVAPHYEKLPLFIDGMNAYKGKDAFKLYEQQIKGISFLCNKGNGLLAYDVGVGKTAAGIVATVNQLQSLRATKPIIVVPNQVYKKWFNDIHELFPTITINDLYNLNKEKIAHLRDEENPHKLNIEEGSISLVTYEALKNFSFTDKTIAHDLKSDFVNLLSVKDDLYNTNETSNRDRAIANEKIAQVLGKSAQVKNDNYIFFDECGFDNITVDEAHNFKNLWTVPRAKNKGESNEYQGISAGKPSNRAIKMYAMTQFVQSKNNDRNVFLLTATPFTNSPLEVYSMLSYIARKRLQETGITSLRDFLDEFAKTKYELGVNAKGEIDTKQVMKNWKQVQSLQKILTEFIDKVDGEEANIIRPNKFTHVQKLEMSDVQKEMYALDEKRMVDSDSPAATIVAMNNMRLVSIAPALANKSMYGEIATKIPPMLKLVETSPKLKFVCDTIIKMYKEHSDKGQFMYVPLGMSSHPFIKEYLIKNGIPKNAIEIINGEINSTPEKKEKVTMRFNDKTDPCKIIIGGKNTCEGIDLNGNSFVMYNCSLGWNPSETIQAEGRIWRQGNLQGHVHIVYPLMNDSIDSVLYQKHDEKRSRINELWTYKGDNLNVEDIKPEELKFDLIKDPKKKANAIEQQKTASLRNELEKIDLKIKSIDELQENKHHFESELNYYKELLLDEEKEIGNAERNGEEISDWRKNIVKQYKTNVKKYDASLAKVNEKIMHLTSALKNANTKNLETRADEYHQNLLTEKNTFAENLQHVKDEMPAILERLEKENAREKEKLPSIDMQKQILSNDILHNLRSMNEVENKIKTARYEKMLSEKVKRNEISEHEYETLKTLGWKESEKKSRENAFANVALAKERAVSENELGAKINNVTVSSNKAQGTQMKTETQYMPHANAQLSLFDMSVADTNTKPLSFAEASREFNFKNDDTHVTEKQLQEAEEVRNKIVFPHLRNDGDSPSEMISAFKDFVEGDKFDILGKKISVENGKITDSGWKELHDAMKIYRSKSIETFRYILIDKNSGEIKEQFALTSHMPDRCATIYDDDMMKKISNEAEQKKCFVVMAHNHPSGDVGQSVFDEENTKALAKELVDSRGQSLFAGHIILDHNNFACYEPDGVWQTKDALVQSADDERLDKNFALKNFMAQNPDALSRVAKKINDENNWNDDFIPCVFCNSENKVTGLRLYDKDFFNKFDDYQRRDLFSDAIRVGADKVFPVLTEHFAKKYENEFSKIESKFKTLLEQNDVTDVSLPAYKNENGKTINTLSEKFGVLQDLLNENETYQRAIFDGIGVNSNISSFSTFDSDITEWERDFHYKTDAIEKNKNANQTKQQSNEYER